MSTPTARRPPRPRTLLAALAVTTLLVSCAGDGSAPTTSASGSPPASSEDLAHAVVRLAPTDAEGNECRWGSGTLVDPEGTILTNFHVISSVPGECEYEEVVISITEDSDRPPTPAYLGAVHAVDPVADLAVVRITSGLRGESVDPDLPFIPVGDSDSVALGDAVRILGYPQIGGETITFTEGLVAGFLSDAEHGERAWIKTSATLAGGNSGGAALDDEGRLIGVPTRASAGETLTAVDCRIIEDTNGDGQIDDSDTCVPIGGFINSLRPMALAEPLLERARTSGPIAIDELVVQPVQPGPSADPEEPPRIGAMVFASDVDEDGRPVDRPVSLPSGSPQLCVLFEYENMVDGTPYDLVWTLDGQIPEQASTTRAAWSGGPSGTWYVCNTNAGSGMADGLWEAAVYLDEEMPARTEAIYVGDAYPPATLEVINDLAEEVCVLRVSPSASGWWGPDELGSETLPPGSSVTVEVGASSYDVRATDCDGDVLAEVDDVAVAGTSTLFLE